MKHKICKMLLIVLIIVGCVYVFFNRNIDRPTDRKKKEIKNACQYVD